MVAVVIVVVYLMVQVCKRLDSVPVFSTDVTRCVVQGGGERHEL